MSARKKDAINAKGVTVDGQRTKAAYLLRAGQHVSVVLPPPAPGGRFGGDDDRSSPGRRPVGRAASLLSAELGYLVPLGKEPHSAMPPRATPPGDLPLC